jgi:hypothetical protein
MARPKTVPEAGVMIPWSIRITERAKNVLLVKAKAKKMSIGEYLDWVTHPPKAAPSTHECDQFQCCTTCKRHTTPHRGCILR